MSCRSQIIGARSKSTKMRGKFDLLSYDKNGSLLDKLQRALSLRNTARIGLYTHAHLWLILCYGPAIASRPRICTCSRTQKHIDCGAINWFNLEKAMPCFETGITRSKSTEK